ncbi:PAS domain S-box protein [Blastopirellula sp. J2-11]|uniref:PAS domain S-box protein n=1 Tax=Blastopirellula sp. J2-11 TaxID=2943192 RepID=UPI0021C8B983|nr:PAS domain S-box protein [Blastopirellula sp. J2-11]UUO07247.1 PAS domain S-box protein [Blastopirellula sp. J2-11]
MPRILQSAFFGYLVAIVVSAACLGLGLILTTQLGESAGMMLLVTAVLIASWWGGLYPGLLSTALCVIVGCYYFLSPLFSPRVDSAGDLLRVALFFVIGVMIAIVNEAKRRAVLREVKRREELRLIMSSIGDAVITTDVNGKITGLNPVAEELTDWTTVEALGRPLTQVFRLVHQHSRKTIDNVALRAAAEEVTVGAATDSILIAKSGRELPVEDSTSPIRDRSGAIIGAVLVFRDVTSRRRTEQKLQSSEERFRALVKATATIVWTTAPNGQIVEDSPTWRAFTGQTFDQWRGSGWLDAVHPDDREHTSESWRIATADRTAYQCEYRLRRSDGEYRWTSVRGVPILNSDGSVREWVGMNVDITDERATAEKVRDSEIRYRLVSEAANDAIWDWDLNTNKVRWNEGLLRNFGYTKSQVGTDASWWKAGIHPEDRQRVIDGIQYAIEHEQERWADEYRFQRADGDYAYVFDRGRIVRDENKPVRMVGSLLDLTERKRNEQILSERSRLAAMRADVSGCLTTSEPMTDVLQRCAEAVVRHLDTALARIWIVDESETILDLKANAGERGHLLAGHQRVVMGEGKIGRIARQCQPLVTNQAPLDPNLSDPQWALREGMVAFAGYPLTIEGRVIGVLATFARHELSDAILSDLAPLADAIAQYVVRKRGEQILERLTAETERQRRLYRTILSTIPDLVYVFDLQHRFTYANDALLKMWGRTWDEAIGKDCFELGYETWHAELHAREIDQVVATCASIRGEVPYTGANGRRIHDYIFLPVFGADGEVEAVAGTTRDITELKETEDAIRENEARLRQLADAMPHIVWSAGPDGEVDYFNNRWHQFTNFKRGADDDRNWEHLLPPDDLTAFRITWSEAVRSGSPCEIEHRFFDQAKNSNRWFLTRAVPVRDANGAVVRWFVSSTDIQRQKRTEQINRFLADASACLTANLDYEATFKELARVAVPNFSDWCAVDLLDENGQPRRVALMHQDPAKVELSNRLNALHPPEQDDKFGIWNIIRNETSELLEIVTDEGLRSTARDDEHLQILQDLKLKSYIGVPLISRGKTIGVLTFCMAESGRLFDHEALRAAEDVSRRAAVAFENSVLYQQLREADRRKDEFLAMLAHELRNPLAPIRSGIDILEIDSPQDVEVLDAMKDQVEHLVRLVDDLLDVSRIMRGKVELRPEVASLSAIVERAVQAVKWLFDEKDHQLEVDLPAESIPIHVDPVRMVQVVSNLLNNAAKYTDPGGHIQLSVDRVDGMAQIRISDDGIGIEPELTAHVFDLFTQSSRALDRAQGGLGIGLTLVRNLVEMHHGAVSVKSNGTGKGSQFIVELPISDAPLPIEVESADDASNIARRILVVDDNIGVARMLSLLLGKLGEHQIELAHDGPTAIAKAFAMRPEMIFLDIGLPNMDGYQVGQRLREDAELDQTLLIALTGYGKEEDRRKSAAAGFDEHLVKPPALDTLRGLFSHPKLSGANPSSL